MPSSNFNLANIPCPAPASARAHAAVPSATGQPGSRTQPSARALTLAVARAPQAVARPLLAALTTLALAAGVLLAVGLAVALPEPSTAEAQSHLDSINVAEASLLVVDAGGDYKFTPSNCDMEVTTTPPVQFPEDRASETATAQGDFNYFHSLDERCDWDWEVCAARQLEITDGTTNNRIRTTRTPNPATVSDKLRKNSYKTSYTPPADTEQTPSQRAALEGLVYVNTATLAKGRLFAISHIFIFDTPSAGTCTGRPASPYDLTVAPASGTMKATDVGVEYSLVAENCAKGANPVADVPITEITDSEQQVNGQRTGAKVHQLNWKCDWRVSFCGAGLDVVYADDTKTSLEPGVFMLHGDADGQRLVHGTHSKQVKQLEFGVTSFGCAKSALKVRNAHNNSAVGGDSANSALDAGVFYMLVPDSCGTGTSSRQVSAAVQTVLDYSQIAATGGVATHNLDNRCNWKFYFCGVSEIALFKGTARSLAGASGVVSGTDLATALSYDSTNTRWEFTSSNTDYEVDTLGMNIAADATGACPGGAAGVSTTVTLFNRLALTGAADFSAFQYDMVPVNCLLADGVAAPAARTDSNPVTGGVSDFLNTQTLDWRCDWLVRFCGSAVKVSDTAVVNDAPQDNVVHAAAVAHGTVFPLAKNLQDRVLDYPTSTQTPKKVTWFELSENLGCADASVQVAAAADEPPIGGVTHSFVPSNCQNVNRSGTALSSGTVAPPMQTRLDGFPAAGGAVEHKLDVRCDWTVKFCTAGVKVGAAASTEAAAFGTVAVNTAFKLDGSISSSERKLVYASATQTADQSKAVDRLWLTGSMATACAEPASSKPALDLVAASDSGSSDSDNLTNDATPTFEVSNVASGSTVSVTATKGSDTISQTQTSISGTTATFNFTGSTCTKNASAAADQSCTLTDGDWTVVANHDDGTNDDTDSDELELEIDTADPTVVVTADESSLMLGGTTTATVTFEISEDTADFALADVTRNAAVAELSAFSSTDANTYTATLTAVMAGTSTIAVAASKFTDTAGNSNPAPDSSANPATGALSLTVNAAAAVKSAAPSSVGLKSGSSPITSVNPEFTVAGVVSGASVTVSATKGNTTVTRTVSASGTSVDVAFTGSVCGSGSAACALSVGTWSVTATQDEDGSAAAKTPSDPTAAFSLVINAPAVTPTKSAAPSSVGLKSGSSPITSVNPEFTVAGVVSGASVTVSATKGNTTVTRTVSASGTSVDVAFMGSVCGSGSAACALSVGTWSVTATQDEDGSAAAKTPSDPTAAFSLVINAPAVTPTKSAAPSSVGLKSGSSPITSVNPEFTVAGVVSGASVTVSATKGNTTVTRTVSASGTSVDVAFMGSVCGSGSAACALSVGTWSVTATQDEDGSAAAKTPSDPTAAFSLVINAPAPTTSSVMLEVAPLTTINPMSATALGVKYTFTPENCDQAVAKPAVQTNADVTSTGSGGKEFLTLEARCDWQVGFCQAALSVWHRESDGSRDWHDTLSSAEINNGDLKLSKSSSTENGVTVYFLVFEDSQSHADEAVNLFTFLHESACPVKSAAPSSVGLMGGGTSTTDVNPTFRVAGVVSGASVTVSATKGNTTVTRTVSASGTSVDVAFTGSVCGSGSAACALSVGTWSVTAIQDEDGSAAAKTPSDPTAAFSLVINAPGVTPTKSAAPSSVGLMGGGTSTTDVNPTFRVAGVVSGASVTVSATKGNTTVTRTVSASGTSVDVAFTGSTCGAGGTAACALSVGTWSVTATQDEDGSGTAKTPSDPTAAFSLVINAPAVTPTKSAKPTVRLQSGSSPITSVNPTFTVGNVVANSTVTVTATKSDSTVVTKTVSGSAVASTSVAVAFTGSTCGTGGNSACALSVGSWTVTATHDRDGAGTAYLVSDASNAFSLVINAPAVTPTKSQVPEGLVAQGGSIWNYPDVNPTFTVVIGVVAGASVTVAAVKGNTTVTKTVTVGASATSVAVPFTGSTCGNAGTSACALSVGTWSVTATHDRDGAGTAYTVSDPSPAFSLVINPAPPTDTTAPRVTPRVSPASGTAASKSYSATDNDPGTTTWRYAKQSSATCATAPPGGASAYTESATVTIASEADNNMYLCFWSTDAANNTGVGQIRIAGIDTTGPTVNSITARPASLLTNAVSTVTFVFSEAVTGFAASDVTITAANSANSSAGSLTSLSGSGTTYTARFTATAADTYTLSLAANGVTDAANNGNTASTSQVNETITVTAPIPDTTFTGRVSVTSTDTLDTDISNRNHAGTRLSVQVSPVGNRAGCSPSRSVPLTLAANGSASAQVANLVDSPAGGAACSYTVRFPSSVRSRTNDRVRLVGQGSATATLSASATTATRAYQAAEIVIAPAAPVVFAVSVANAGSVTEGETLVFPVSVPGPASQPVEISYTVSGLGEEDSTGSETIAAGSSATAISVATDDDKLDGPNRTVRVTLTSATGASIDSQGRTATGIVKDDDDPPTAGLTEVSIKVDRLVLAVTLSDRSARDVKVNFTTTVGSGTLLVSAGDLTAETFVVFGADQLPSGGSLRVRLVSAQNATIDVNARERLVRDPQQTWQFHVTSRRVTPSQMAQSLELTDGWKLFSWRDASQRWVPHTAASGGSTALAAGTTVVFRGSDPSEAMLEAAGLGRPSSLTFSPGWNIFTPAPGAIGLTSDDFTTTSAGGSAVLFSSELVDCTTNAGVLVIYTYDQSDPQALIGWRISLPCHPELQARFDIPAIASIDENDTIYAYFYSGASVELTFANGQYSPA